MGEFFQGWRRKIGVLTLMMACVFTNIWFITNHRCFELVSAIGEPIQILTARKGFFRWSSYMDINTTAAPFLWQSWPASENNIEPMDAPLMRIEWQWHLSWFGFEFGKGRCHGSSPMAVWAVPYWSIAIPMTLASAFLLLTNPRNPTSKTSLMNRWAIFECPWRDKAPTNRIESTVVSMSKYPRDAHNRA